MMLVLGLLAGCRYMQEQRAEMMSVCSGVKTEVWSQDRMFCEGGINELYAGNRSVRPCLIGAIPGFCAEEDDGLMVYAI